MTFEEWWNGYGTGAYEFTYSDVAAAWDAASSEARRAALEEAAQTCERESFFADGIGLAAIIRAVIEKENSDETA